MTKTILIVDDSESIRTILRLTLQFSGYQILEAEDGKQACEILERNLCDLVITDLAMPVMTGVDLLRKIREELKNTALPIIICTAEKASQQEDLLKKGATMLMEKPVSPRELLEIVKNILSG
jgi:two-component system chemotaxis response regulator CheY